jgi:hypothetical protein
VPGTVGRAVTDLKESNYAELMKEDSVLMWIPEELGYTRSAVSSFSFKGTVGTITLKYHRGEHYLEALRCWAVGE